MRKQCASQRVANSNFKRESNLEIKVKSKYTHPRIVCVARETIATPAIQGRPHMEDKHPPPPPSPPSARNIGAGDTAANRCATAPSAAVDRTNLIVNYIPQSTSERDLTGLFKLAGDLESVKIMRHPRTGYSYGYGFVKYQTEEGAMRAIELFNRFPYRNKTLKVSFSRPASQVTKNANLYISNLPKHITDDQLQLLFGKFGEIIQKRVLCDKVTGAPKGVAFVRYARGEDAQRAICELNGFKLMHAPYPLRVRIADDFSQQRAIMMYGGGGGGGGGGGSVAEPLSARGMGPLPPPPAFIARNYTQMRNHEFLNYHRQIGGGGDFDWLPNMHPQW